MPTEFDRVRDALGLGEPHEVWRAGFPESAALASGDKGWLWNEPTLMEACSAAGLGEDVWPAFLEALTDFRSDGALRRLLWHVHHVIFSPGGPLTSEAAVPLLPGTRPGERMFYAFVFLSTLPTVQALHRAREIPPDVTADTLGDIAVWMRHYRERNGAWGFTNRWWPSLHFTGNLYALGRLQYQLNKFYLPFVAYRRRGGDDIVEFPLDGNRFRADGLFDVTNGVNDPAAWTASLVEDRRHMRGHPVRPDGTVAREPIELPATEWECVLRHNDPVLDVHIPATGPMDDDAVQRSFARAQEFFPRHFPEYDFKGFMCVSWLLDPQLREHLPADSNIVRFLDRYRLLPAPGASAHQTFERVLGEPNIALDIAPTNTRLQRVVVAHAKAGGKWRTGAGWIPREPR